MVDEPKSDSVDVDETLEAEIEKLIGGGKSLEKNKENRKVVDLVLILFHNLPLLFPQSIRKKQEKGKYHKFCQC